MMLTLSLSLRFVSSDSAEKPILVNDLAASVGSSVFLGFGIVFLFLAVGLYV